MKYTMMKVFNPLRAPRPVFEVVSLEQRNDSYASWTIGSEYSSCGETAEEREAVDQWLIENGAEKEEKVLLWISW